jgi:hypothetical protein
MILTEFQIIEKVNQFLETCDYDELAKLTEHLFGGECNAFEEQDGNENYTGNIVLDFQPNENYNGAFGEI